MKRVRIQSIERDGDRAIVLTYRGDGEKNQVEIPGGFDELKSWVRASVQESMDLAVLLALSASIEKAKSLRDVKQQLEGKAITLDLHGGSTSKILVVSNE